MYAVAGDAKGGGAHVPTALIPLCVGPELPAPGRSPLGSPGLHLNPGKVFVAPLPLKAAGGTGLSWAQGGQRGGLRMPNVLLLC